MAVVTADNTVDASRALSPVEVRTIVMEFAGSPATTESRALIDMFKGEQVIEIIVDADALGANTSYSVGNSLAGTIDNAARFVASATVSTGATTTRINTAGDLGRGYVFTSDGTIDVTAVGSGAWTGTFRLTVLFKRAF